MGLDIYNLSNQSIFLTSVDSTESISDGLDELKRKTGLTIDSYGQSRIYLDQIKLLNEKTDEKSEWKPIFESAINKGHGLLIEGD